MTGYYRPGKGGRNVCLLLVSSWQLLLNEMKVAVLRFLLKVYGRIISNSLRQITNVAPNPSLPWMKTSVQCDLPIFSSRSGVCTFTPWLGLRCEVCFVQWDVSRGWKGVCTLGFALLLHLESWEPCVIWPKLACWRKQGHDGKNQSSLADSLREAMLNQPASHQPTCWLTVVTQESHTGKLSQPTESWTKENCYCYFKSLNFGVVCYIARDNWYTLFFSKHKAAYLNGVHFMPGSL